MVSEAHNLRHGGTSASSEYRIDQEGEDEHATYKRVSSSTWGAVKDEMLTGDGRGDHRIPLTFRESSASGGKLP